MKNGANTSFTSAATRSFTLAAGVSAPSSNIDAGSNLTVGGSTINFDRFKVHLVPYSMSLAL
ncbi:MAG: hypothetical protein IPQ18_13845 [Saprospiraceae bacterium]|nr:hypothetical protein [Saprospiraceae bacterium]